MSLLEVDNLQLVIHERRILRGVSLTAEAGEVLVTATTRDLTLDAGLEYEERGSFELKGVRDARVLYAVRA